MKRIVKESYEVSPELEQRLNSILADEFLAAEFYRLAELAMKGKKQHLLSEIAEENGEDELEDHFKNLSEWMQSKGLRVVTNHDEMLDITGATVFTVEDGDSTEEIVDKLIQSEEEAIEAYENLIPDTDLDLRVMLCGFLRDEREHLKVLMDVRDEMGVTLTPSLTKGSQRKTISATKRLALTLGTGKMTKFKAIIVAALATLLTGCMNVYVRWPTTSREIESVYQSTVEMAGVTWIASFP